MHYLTRSPFDPGRRTMFWEPARGRHAARLAQAVYKDPSNRLLELPIVEIMKRRLMVVLLQNQLERGSMSFATKFQTIQALYAAGWPGKIEASAIPAWMFGTQTPENLLGGLVPFSKTTTDTLYAISQDPTSKEIDDADRLDAFFGPSQLVYFPSKEYEGRLFNESYPYQDFWYTQPCLDGYFYPGGAYGTFKGFKPTRTDPNSPDFHIGEKLDMRGRFWCSPWAEGKVQEAPPNAVVYGGPPEAPNLSIVYGGIESLRANFWGLTLGEPWETVRPWFNNAVLADKVLKDYPFPSPFGEYIGFWTRFGLPGLRELIRTPVELAAEDIRVWITFSVLAHYSEMVDALDSYFKGQARSEKRRALVATIAGVVIGAIVLAAALPAIIAAIASSAVSAMNKINAHEFAKNMGEIQDAFKASDPAFAAQVGEASAYVARLSAALEAAVDKEHVTRTLSSSALSTGLMIGGGLAAIGALALAIFRK